MTLPLANATILLVEDDPNAQLVTLDLLRMGGANRCYSRRSVDSAIAFAEKLPQVDLFLVDINMPQKSGFDLLDEVRQHDRLKKALVVAVSAGTLDIDTSRIRKFGFDGFISKPLRAAEFARQVQRILDGERIWEVN
ncbi:MAG: response regulator [Ardenticatenaceae bacterium]|nr:response regulator [Ardenticatenaceae bacterium]MCB8950348.1 response regulator [Ardenticatenaceae bacterium]